VQGYVEGEYVYVASPRAGALETLSVQRGTNVPAGAALFELEHAAEAAARDQAARRLEEGRARLADAGKGQRSSEIEALEAQLAQARSMLTFSENELKRQSELASKDVSSPQDLDKARTGRDRDKHRVAELEAELETARLGSRSDQIAAEEANVRALEAVLARAEWDLGQKRQTAPAAGLVFDTLYRQGEWVPAGRPVISLLPPAGIKVRAFVPESRIGSLHVGGLARVFVDGAGEVAGKISFISPRAEYTPPVIYSQESRDKLVFMIEVTFEPDVAVQLHPGQPVDVHF
jgi:HlyD family secretion protein